MTTDDQIDTDAAGILIGEGLDVPTAIVASIRDPRRRPARHNGRAAFDAGLLIGLVLSILWLLW